MTENSYRKHQCDERLLHSAQDSIRNVYAIKINLSYGTSCNITNLEEYDLTLVAQMFSEKFLAKTKQKFIILRDEFKTFDLSKSRFQRKADVVL
jgi:hypothetical protein